MHTVYLRIVLCIYRKRERETVVFVHWYSCLSWMLHDVTIFCQPKQQCYLASRLVH